MRKYRKFFSIGKHLVAFCLILSLSATAIGQVQTLNAHYLEYIERYRSIAIEHQRDYGVPAAITLAQGLLESNAGRSYLARRGNNHFGIKCYSWRGPVVEFDDTLQHNCYRNYDSPEDSFLDHAKFLKGKRYSPLYELEVTDYRAWANGLRECGYAEDPAYPQKLIALIEQYGLHALATNTVPMADGDQSDRHAARVVDAFATSRDGELPSRAEIDHRVARSLSSASHRRGRPLPTRSNSSADND